MTRPLFILRSHNDIDHISPLIYKYVVERKNPLVLFNSSYDFSEDTRINFIRKAGNIELISRPDYYHEKHVIHLGSESSKNLFSKIVSKFYYQILKRHSLFGKIFRKYFVNYLFEYNFLKEKKIGIVFVEWGNPFNKGLNFEKYIIAAKGIGLTIFSLPHGLNTFLNSDLHEVSINSIKKRGTITSFSNWNFYDFLIVQTKFHKDHFVRFGLDANKVKVWGSLRFCKIWFYKNLDINKSFKSKLDIKNKCKIVFMMPHWVYNVDKKATLSLVSKILNIDNICLVIKDHTREDTGDFPKNQKKQLQKNHLIEFNSSSSSVSLIRWSDITINFGSSIGLEVLLQNKLLINPKYLTDNIQAHTGESIALNPKNDNEVIDAINEFMTSGKLNDVQEKNEIIKNLIYASREEYDVSQYYYDEIEKLLNPFYLRE